MLKLICRLNRSSHRPLAHMKTGKVEKKKAGNIKIKKKKYYEFKNTLGLFINIGLKATYDYFQ